MFLNGGKIDQKWTLGGLKISRRVATTDFQPSQSPFLLDFAVLPRISSFFLTILLFIPEIRSLNRIIGRKIFRK